MTEKMIRRKKFRKIQNSFIKLNTSPSDETVQLKINCKAILFKILFVSFSFTNSLFAKGNLKASLIIFCLLCVLS